MAPKYGRITPKPMETIRTNILLKVFRRQLYSRCSISSQAELFALLLPLLGSGLIARP